MTCAPWIHSISFWKLLVMKCLIEFLFVKFVQVCVSVWEYCRCLAKRELTKKICPLHGAVFCPHRPSKELFFVGDPEELTQERKCLQWWFKNLLDKQVLWYREAPKHVFFYRSKAALVLFNWDSLLAAFLVMLRPLFWMGQLAWTFSRLSAQKLLDYLVDCWSGTRPEKCYFGAVGHFVRKLTQGCSVSSDELLQLVIRWDFCVKTWWSLKGTRLKPKEWVNSLNCGPFMDQNPFYSATDIDVQSNKEKVNRW